MPRLVHLSDLHFGAHDERLVEAVEARVDELKPDLVVISGDFTQRARTEQFKEACEFLERLQNAGHEVLAQLSGRMRRFRIKVVPGDRVTVGVSPYDPVRGIITFRAR